MPVEDSTARGLISQSAPGSRSSPPDPPLLDERHTQSEPTNLKGAGGIIGTPPGQISSSDTPNGTESQFGNASSSRNSAVLDLGGEVYRPPLLGKEVAGHKVRGQTDLKAPLPSSDLEHTRRGSGTYSFDPWASVPPLSPSSEPNLLLHSNFTPPQEAYTTLPTIPLTQPLAFSYQEHIWSRTRQEQQLALQQRQQREQLQLQLQQQDEWYLQESFQRQQQDVLRSQQRLVARPVPSNLNAYELPTSPPNPIVPPSPSYNYGPSIDSLNTNLLGLSPTETRVSTLNQLEGGYQNRSMQPQSSNNVRPADWSNHTQSRLSINASGNIQPQGVLHSVPLGASPPPNLHPQLVLPHHPSTSHIILPPPSRPPFPSLFSNISALSSGSVSTTIAPSLVAPVRTMPPQRAPFETLKSGLPVVPDRSPFAMWSGNIPGDATHEELWKFFSGRSAPNSRFSTGQLDANNPGTVNQRLLDEGEIPGVESIHLIGRSNCAFVNYISETHLLHAIEVSNGISLRPLDRRCKPLVCRVRMREDDAKSGVGAQRGGGLHKAYIADLNNNSKGKGKELDSGMEGKMRTEDGSESGSGEESNASTTSSSLERYFPKRFFILKSHNLEDLEESVETQLWSTQGHNEAVLDQAYRTAKEGVYIVFSANKSGEWFGYAKMSGPILTAREVPLAGFRSPASTVDTSLPNSAFPFGNASREASRSGASRSEAPPGDASAMDTSTTPSETWKRPFKVEWIKVQKVPFVRTRHILNAFNASREVKISRDGTEIEPLAGEHLLNVFWAEPQRRPSIRRPSAPSGRPPSFPSGSSGSGIQNSHPRIHYHPRQY